MLLFDLLPLPRKQFFSSSGKHRTIPWLPPRLNVLYFMDDPLSRAGKYVLFLHGNDSFKVPIFGAFDRFSDFNLVTPCSWWTCRRWCKFCFAETWMHADLLKGFCNSWIKISNLYELPFYQRIIYLKKWCHRYVVSWFKPNELFSEKGIRTETFENGTIHCSD